MLIVNFNYEKYLEQAVDSALNQDYPELEIVVCDDGSSDGSVRLLEKLAGESNNQLRLVAKANGGVASALNEAFAASHGDIVCLLDADDTFRPGKISRVAREFQRSASTGIIVNAMVKFGDDGRTFGLIPEFGKLDHGWIRDQMLRSGGHWSFAPASGISLRRTCAEQIFPIPEQQFRTEADSYIFTQAPLSWAVAAIDEPLSGYRLHGSNVTSSEKIDANYTRRVINGIERMHSALSKSAAAMELGRPRLADNPTYAEMTLLRDYVEGKSRGTLLTDLVALYRAAWRCRTADRLRWRIKPFALTVVMALPRKLGHRLISTIYLPTGWRSKLTTFLLARRRTE